MLRDSYSWKEPARSSNASRWVAFNLVWNGDSNSDELLSHEINEIGDTSIWTPMSIHTITALWKSPAKGDRLKYDQIHDRHYGAASGRPFAIPGPVLAFGQ
jgi:hypothetical protein